jgi:hypothetical protein
MFLIRLVYANPLLSIILGILALLSAGGIATVGTTTTLTAFISVVYAWCIVGLVLTPIILCRRYIMHPEFFLPDVIGHGETIFQRIISIVALIVALVITLPFFVGVELLTVANHLWSARRLKRSVD